MRTHFSNTVQPDLLAKRDLVMRAAVSKPREVLDSRPGRRVEQLIRGDDLVLIYPSSRTSWVETEDSTFAAQHMGAEREYLGGVIGQSMALPVYEMHQGSLSYVDDSTLNLALTKAYQFALMYPTLKFIMPDMGMMSKRQEKLEELMFDLVDPPSNLLLAGPWDSLRNSIISKKKSARLVISGSAIGVNNDFVYDEIYEEVKYLKSEGYERITLCCFYLHGAGNARGDIRIPVTCSKIMKDCDIDFFRFIFEKERYVGMPPHFFAYLNASLATHILHFQPIGTRSDFAFQAYYEGKGIVTRELLLDNQPAAASASF